LIQQGSRRAQEINAEGYMQKPLSFPKLICLVNKLVEEYAAPRYYKELL
jgi:hypothetical protein